MFVYGLTLHLPTTSFPDVLFRTSGKYPCNTTIFLLSYPYTGGNYTNPTLGIRRANAKGGIFISTPINLLHINFIFYISCQVFYSIELYLSL